MTFNPNVRLDPSEVTDIRGRGVGRGGGLAIGGGGFGLDISPIVAILVLYVVAGLISGAIRG
jgi:hypothetical protein